MTTLAIVLAEDSNALAAARLETQAQITDTDAVIRELAWHQARREEAPEVALKLIARYGETHEWDARTWDEYQNLVDARAWQRVQAALGGAS